MIFYLNNKSVAHKTGRTNETQFKIRQTKDQGCQDEILNECRVFARSSWMSALDLKSAKTGKIVLFNYLLTLTSPMYPSCSGRPSGCTGHL